MIKDDLLKSDILTLQFKVKLLKRAEDETIEYQKCWVDIPLLKGKVGESTNVDYLKELCDRRLIESTIETLETILANYK